MAKHPKTPATKEAEGIFVKDPASAAIIYFDGAPNFGNSNGIVNITLAATRHLAAGGGIDIDVVAVGFLRCTVAAAIDLRRAIDNVLLIGAPTEGGTN